MDWNFKPKVQREKADARWYLLPLAIVLMVIGLALLSEWMAPTPPSLDSRTEPTTPVAPAGA